MKNYFSNFPYVNYNGKIVRNIILKSNILKDLLLDTSQFYNYQIKDGEKPVSVAFDYYGSVDYVWLVMLSNQILDPYFEWVLSTEELDQHIIKKYGSIEEAQATIVGYVSDVSADDSMITPETYQYVYGSVGASLYSPVFAYEYEIDQNEKKRNIKLIDNFYTDQISLELEKSLK